MLTFIQNGDVLLVREHIMSFTKTETRFWYYNLRTKMGNSLGKEGDVLDRPLNEADQAWIKTHYLPKIGLKDFP